jgi:hypothetical protein
MFMVSARSKLAAINGLKSGKACHKEILLQTPHSEILKRRKYWKDEIARLQEVERVEDEMARRAARR